MKLKNLSVFLIFLFLIIVGIGCTSEDLSVNRVWVRPATKGANSAIFFTIENPTKQDVSIVEVKVDVSEYAELHRSQMDANGIMRMERQERVLVPAGGRVVFEPGGVHVMLIGLKQDLSVGEKVKMTLIFDNGNQIELEAPVKEQ